MSIARLLAAEFGLQGTTAMQKAQVDEAVDFINDLAEHLYTAHYAGGENRKNNILEAYMNNVPDGLAKLEQYISNRGGQYLAGNMFTWADLHFLQFVDMITTMNPQA